MFEFLWRGYSFRWIQGGMGIFTSNIAYHVHSKNSYELHYIVSGKGLLRTDGGEYSLSEGVFFVTGPDIYHEQLTDEKDPLTEVYCYLQASDKKNNDILVSAFLERRFYIGKHKKYRKFFLQIADEVAEMNIGYECLIESSLLFVMTDYARRLIGKYKDSKFVTDTDLNDKRFLQIEVELMNNCKKITLASLSEKIGLCERQTQRLIGKYYGMSFSQIKQKMIHKQKGDAK